ncbi:MAG: hypothetical protein P8016_00585 [Sedimentisphaerales bacterium]
MAISGAEYVEQVGSQTYTIKKSVKETAAPADTTKARALSYLLCNRWTFGCLFSFAFIWIISAIFCNSSEPYSYNEDTKSWVITPGSKIIWKTEGYGRSYFGKFGLGFIPDISEERRKVVMLWGDSFVEAFQVDDKYKMTQQLTKLLAKDDQNLICASRAMGGDNIADYILNIPQYEKIIPSISRHIIVINGSADILPDQSNDTRGIFSAKNGYKLIRSDTHFHSASVKSLINKYRLYFLLPILQSVTRDISLRFTPGHVYKKHFYTNDNQSNKQKELQSNEAWEFLTKAIKESTNKNVTIVYVPHVPRIENHRIAYNDPDWSVVGEFAEYCHSAGIDFINMHDIFVSNYMATGKFPKGFTNSLPGEGHLNIDGHRLIAEAIFKYLKEKEQ